LVSSNECSAYQTLPLILLPTDAKAINKCKEGYFWCQYSNSSRQGLYDIDYILYHIVYLWKKRVEAYRGPLKTFRNIKP